MIYPGQSDTICAIATPIGKGGIGIVRLSGANALTIAERCFQPHQDRPLRQATVSQYESHTVHHGWIIDLSTNERVDEVLLTPMRAPRSYTREDIVEISGHGGPAVLARILEVCLRAGARLAEPGEFTKLAFLSGRLDLSQAEAVMALIHAESEAAHRLALRQLQGDVSSTIRQLRHRCVALLADCEASLDFVDDELEFLSTERLREELTSAHRQVLALLRSAQMGKWLRTGACTVITGRPNVGKSSLFNTLLQRDRAIVTPYPGTTRDLLEETMTIDTLPLRLIDTAGLHESQNPIEQEGILRARRSCEGADLLLVVLDGSQPLTQEDWSILAQADNDKTICVFNKLDISSPLDESAVAAQYPFIPRVQISATEGTGCDELKQRIKELLCSHAGALTGQAIISHARHEQALASADEALTRAITAVDSGLSGEFIATDLNEAIDQLGSIIGIREAITEELLDQVFSQFCIGK